MKRYGHWVWRLFSQSVCRYVRDRWRRLPCSKEKAEIMNELFKQYEERLPLVNSVKLGSYKEVEDLSLETITRATTDKDVKLNGMLLYGYETKFADGTNENGERYSKDALDVFIEKYYKANKLNMPLTIQHRDDIEHLAGRVLVIEVNRVGFYFVCYIPKTYAHYEQVRALISEGVLQGLSKEGWSTRGKAYWTKEGDFDYYLIEEMEMLAVSLVTTPANGNPLEKAKEIRNTLQFVKHEDNAKDARDAFEAMFNN